MVLACWLRAPLAIRSTLQTVTMTLTALVFLIPEVCLVSLRLHVFRDLVFIGTSVLLPETGRVDLSLGSVTLLDR